MNGLWHRSSVMALPRQDTVRLAAAHWSCRKGRSPSSIPVRYRPPVRLRPPCNWYEARTPEGRATAPAAGRCWIEHGSESRTRGGDRSVVGLTTDCRRQWRDASTYRRSEEDLLGSELSELMMVAIRSPPGIFDRFLSATPVGGEAVGPDQLHRGSPRVRPGGRAYRAGRGALSPGCEGSGRYHRTFPGQVSMPSP